MAGTAGRLCQRDCWLEVILVFAAEKPAWGRGARGEPRIPLILLIPCIVVKKYFLPGLHAQSVFPLNTNLSPQAGVGDGRSMACPIEICAPVRAMNWLPATPAMVNSTAAPRSARDW
jgi:hypothetical protein